MYVTVKADRTVSRHDGIPTLEQMYDVVEAGAAPGHRIVEALGLDNAGSVATMWLNEEGKYAAPDGAPLPTNAIATAAALVMLAIHPADRICGDVVFTGGPDNEGEITSLPESFARLLERAV